MWSKRKKGELASWALWEPGKLFTFSGCRILRRCLKLTRDHDRGATAAQSRTYDVVPVQLGNYRRGQSVRQFPSQLPVPAASSSSPEGWMNV